MGIILAYIALGIMCITVIGGFGYILYMNIKNDREEANQQKAEKSN